MSEITNIQREQTKTFDVVQKRYKTIRFELSEMEHVQTFSVTIYFNFVKSINAAAMIQVRINGRYDPIIYTEQNKDNFWDDVNSIIKKEIDDGFCFTLEQDRPGIIDKIYEMIKRVVVEEEILLVSL